MEQTASRSWMLVVCEDAADSKHIVEKDGLGDLRIPFVTDSVAAFSAVPAGNCNGSSFNNAGNNANFWSSSQNSSNNAYNRNLNYNNANVNRNNNNKNNGFSVRCPRY